MYSGAIAPAFGVFGSVLDFAVASSLTGVAVNFDTSQGELIIGFQHHLSGTSVHMRMLDRPAIAQAG